MNNTSFKKAAPTITNSSNFKQNIIDSFINGAQTDSIYMDMEKSFDKIDHEL